jgi:hypothetical protein
VVLVVSGRTEEIKPLRAALNALYGGAALFGLIWIG